jgi:magnesium chelatase family protein
MYGPPGTGKTMLAKAFAGILPQLSREASLIVTGIHSAAGRLKQHLITQPPIRAPHHASSYGAMIGGGTFPRPGEVTLAHRGVLFLDEFPEFDRRVIETLREPLEDHIITISRSKGSETFPSHFILIAAMNPCPCGYAGSTVRRCICAPFDVARYRKKISGPIIDRIDLHVEVPRIKFEKLSEDGAGENSVIIKERVNRARKIQTERFKGTGVITNSEMSSEMTKKFCNLTEETAGLLKNAVNPMHLSARAYFRILKLARTIADLSGEEKIGLSHVAEALQYRPKVD